jgi:hypothetical protein
MNNLRGILIVQGVIALLIIGMAVYIGVNFSRIDLSMAIALFAICLIILLAILWILYSTFKRNIKKQ